MGVLNMNLKMIMNIICNVYSKRLLNVSGVTTSFGNSPLVRHGRQEAFDHETGTCDKKENAKTCEENKEEFVKKNF